MNRRGFLSLFAAAPVAAPVLAAGALANPLPVPVRRSATEVFRDYSTPGVAASGRHAPLKSEIREWGASIERALQERGIIDMPPTAT